MSITNIHYWHAGLKIHPLGSNEFYPWQWKCVSEGRFRCSCFQFRLVRGLAHSNTFLLPANPLNRLLLPARTTRGQRSAFQNLLTNGWVGFSLIVNPTDVCWMNMFKIPVSGCWPSSSRTSDVIRSKASTAGEKIISIGLIIFYGSGPFDQQSVIGF